MSAIQRMRQARAEAMKSGAYFSTDTDDAILELADWVDELRRQLAGQRTPAEEEQRRSFAFGNVSLANPAVTREMVDRAADGMAASGGAKCTGITATWCPVHGDCKCPEDGDNGRTLCDESCPLHSTASTHGADLACEAAEREEMCEVARAVVDAAKAVRDQGRLDERGDFGTFVEVPLPAMAKLIAALSAAGHPPRPTVEEFVEAARPSRGAP